jgi:secreted PhoX family phosphatase
VVVRWGDPLFAGAPEFDPAAQTPATARRQFGFNNDYTAFMPLTFGSGRSDHGLLIVNHEYPLPHLMFAGLTADKVAATVSRDQVDICIASCGVSFWKSGSTTARGRWRRRAATTAASRRHAVRISGPVSGHEKLRTKADPTGTHALGTHDNCNGGSTPWGTILTCEEGSADFFGGHVERHPDRAHMERNHYESSPHGRYGWARFHERFDFDREPNEPNRFEWVVEIDPFDPGAPPVKRTALGRFAHEGAHCALAPMDGWSSISATTGNSNIAIASSATAGRPGQPAANRDLLDHGTLLGRAFRCRWQREWLPLVWNHGPLTPANGFASQADVTAPHPSRGRPAGRDADGFAGGIRARSGDRSCVHRADGQ